LPAEKAGILRIIAQEVDTLEIGAVVCTIEDGDAPAKSGDTSKKEAAPASKEESNTASQTASDESPETYAAGTPPPAAAKILREKGIDPSSIKGTGKDGRIKKEDAEKAQNAPAKTEAKIVSSPAVAPTAPVSTGERV